MIRFLSFLMVAALVSALVFPALYVADVLSSWLLKLPINPNMLKLTIMSACFGLLISTIGCRIKKKEKYVP